MRKIAISISFILICSTSNTQSMKKQENWREKLYSEEYLSNQLNIPIYPNTSSPNESQYSVSNIISISTIYRKILFTITKDPCTNKYFMIEKKAFDEVFPRSSHLPFYTKIHTQKPQQHQNIWETLQKTLEEKTKDTIKKENMTT